MKKIVVGKIVNTFGLKGELKVLMQNITKLDEFFVEGFDGKFKCEKQVDKKGYVKIKIVGYDDINQVMQFLNHNIVIEIDAKNLEDGQYLISDLIGSKIVFKGKQLGVITDVENFGATDILVYKSNGAEHRVPLVEHFFDKISPEEKTLIASDKFFEGAVWSLIY